MLAFFTEKKGGRNKEEWKNSHRHIYIVFHILKSNKVEQKLHSSVLTYYRWQFTVAYIHVSKAKKNTVKILAYRHEEKKKLSDILQMSMSKCSPHSIFQMDFCMRVPRFQKYQFFILEMSTIAFHKEWKTTHEENQSLNSRLFYVTHMNTNQN